MTLAYPNGGRCVYCVVPLRSTVVILRSSLAARDIICIHDELERRRKGDEEDLYISI